MYSSRHVESSFDSASHTRVLDSRRPDHGLIEAIVRFARSSPYKMTHRFLKGTRTWEKWFYDHSPSVKFDHCYQTKCLLRALHRLHVDTVEMRKINWFECYYNTRAVAKEIANRARGVYPEFGTVPSKRRTARKPVNTALSRRSIDRAARYQARRESGWVPPKLQLVRSNAVRKPRSEGPGYVPPHKRQLVEGQTCTKCRSPLRRVYVSAKAHPFQDFGFGVTTTGPENRHLFPTDSYYHIWIASASGLWTYEDVKRHFDKRIVTSDTITWRGEENVFTEHRARHAQHRWETCHPLRCMCTAGLKRANAKKLKLSLG